MKNFLNKFFSNKIAFYVLSIFSAVALAAVVIAHISQDNVESGAVKLYLYVLAAIFLVFLMIAYKNKNKNLLLSIVSASVVLTSVSACNYLEEYLSYGESVDTILAIIYFVISLVILGLHFYIHANSKPNKWAILVCQIFVLIFVLLCLGWDIFDIIYYSDQDYVLLYVVEFLFTCSIAYSIIFIETRVNGYRFRREEENKQIENE